MQKEIFSQLRRANLHQRLDTYFLGRDKFHPRQGARLFRQQLPHPNLVYSLSPVSESLQKQECMP